jgi:cytochrome c-type biogenesis protein CcmH
MTVFWIVAALFVGGALLLMLPALMAPRAGAISVRGANQAAHDAALKEAEADLAAGLISPERLEQVQRDIERRRRTDEDGASDAADTRPGRRSALAIALLLPLASVLAYLQLGRPDAVVPQLVAAPAGAQHAVTAEQIQQRVAVLAERLAAEPGDASGWLMLGRSYTALGRYADAATAFRKAVDLLPPDANLLADLADVAGMAQGKRLAGEPARLVQRALDIDPRHVKALALAGSVAFQARDFAAARGYWERVVAVVPPDSPVARSMRGSIAEAAQLEGADAPAAPVSAVALQGEVIVSPALAARVQPGDTLFVFARAVQGQRMPLAIQRGPVGSGRRAFRLDDSMAMAPGLRLSGFQQVMVGARISRSGQATPQPGDLTGQIGPVAPGAAALRITIDSVQP